MFRRYYSAYLMSFVLIGLAIVVLVVALSDPASAKTPERASAGTPTRSPSALAGPTARPSDGGSNPPASTPTDAPTPTPVPKFDLQSTADDPASKGKAGDGSEGKPKPVDTFREQESYQPSRPQFEAALESAFPINPATPTPTAPTVSPTPTAFPTMEPAVAEAGTFWFDPEEPD